MNELSKKRENKMYIVEIATNEDIEKILEKYPQTKQVICNWGSDCYTLVIKETNEIIAFASCFRRVYNMPTISWKEDWINVIDVIIPEKKRRGLGSLLLTKIMEIAKENGSHQVAAYSDISNYDAHAFWIKCGFAVMPVKDNAGKVCGSIVGYKL
jgi:GNAT superfamily N-acetyltransferase